jgi:phosphopantothenoylcysteine decarboxylase
VANVLLGVTGSVAAILTPALFAKLRLLGHQVRVVATPASVYFFDPAELDPSHAGRNPAVVSLDEDEWPGRTAGQRWRRSDEVLHIELRRWADVFLIAPLDANTLAKLAAGLADNCLTCVYRAWDPNRPVILAPAMNTLMWEHPLTRRHFRQLGEDAFGFEVPTDLDRDGVLVWINRHCPRRRVAPPQSKRLACGDIGVGAMASVDEIAEVVTAVTNSTGNDRAL